ncbi:hypothetical protein [Microbacterium sp.]|uniref:hypothetical protein n=1 Tax=Microbacterium sp. TaxID=51671 RepID=UPI003C75AB16
MSNDLPEGVINAEPAGGWESGEIADEETAEATEREAASANEPSDDVEADAE